MCVCVCVCAASIELTFAGKALFVYRIHLYFIILLLKVNHLVRKNGYKKQLLNDYVSLIVEAVCRMGNC